MICKIADLRNKQVVSVETGTVLGFINDLEINTVTGEISNVIIYGKAKFMGFLGRDEDIAISWNSIEVIGEETILVKGPIQFASNNRKIL